MTQTWWIWFMPGLYMHCADMGTKPEVMKPKLWSNYEAEAEAKALTFWKHEAEAEAHVLPSQYKYPFLLLITHNVLTQANYTGKHDLKIKIVVFFSSFETRKPNVKFWICEVTKPKLKPKLLSIHEAEAKAEVWVFETTKLKPKPKLWPKMLRLREAESESEAASYPCLALCWGYFHLSSENLAIPKAIHMSPWCIFTDALKKHCRSYISLEILYKKKIK